NVFAVVARINSIFVLDYCDVKGIERGQRIHPAIVLFGRPAVNHPRIDYCWLAVAVYLDDADLFAGDRQMPGESGIERSKTAFGRWVGTHQAEVNAHVTLPSGHRPLRRCASRPHAVRA